MWTTTTSGSSLRRTKEREESTVESEIDDGAELHEASRQNRIRPQPRAAGYEREVVRDDGIAVQDVVDVEPHVRARSTEPENLGEPHIQHVQPVAIHAAGFDQVDRRVPRAARQRPAQGLGDLRNGE